MKYLIFGAGGFLGSTMVQFLKESGEVVYEVARNADKGFIPVDITKPEQFDSIVVLPDIIINCASALPDVSKRFDDPNYLRTLFETNTIGGANIMNWAASKGIRRIINCSTLVVVNKPWPVPLTEVEKTYPKGSHVGYSASKLSQELIMSSIAEAHSLELLHMRISALYGPGMKEGGILQKLIQQARSHEALQLTNGNNVSFDFLHVYDAVKALYHVSKMEAWPDRILNLASGEEVSLLELAEKIYQFTGNSSDLITNIDNENVSSRAKVDTSLLEKYLEGSGISTKSFAEKVKSML
ncbi:NAD(P)-dependent oxidoreductase [Pontibacter sp. JH31]|uniref:NAD(P)-dependent oxidoreductase n=1 Tax=Pontibacter aquaedesilientis TaxID=2766980 RepID=A0ABR7XF86_9BACT|nr:NAD(P)-dependent oxidoreductase [Pontibacter aquaedesilientis]MBD1396963.1 NAD(P)-dependent oxidoreductase [Pontibacter aquaedesilientis]